VHVTTRTQEPPEPVSLAMPQRGRIALGYVVGVILVLLGLPLFLGYGGAIFPLVIGVAVLVRTRRRERQFGLDTPLGRPDRSVDPRPRG